MVGKSLVILLFGPVREEEIHRSLEKKIRSENFLSVFVRYYCGDKTKDDAVWTKCLMWEKCEMHKTGVHKFLMPCRRGD